MAFTRILASTLTFLVLGFFKSTNALEQKEEPNFYPYVDEITAALIHEARTEYKLYCCGGGGRMCDDVKEICISLQSPRVTRLEEARILYVLLTEKFIDKINAHKRIRPFLRNYPADHYVADVELKFPSSKNPKPDEEVHFVYQAHGTIYYSTHLSNRERAKVKEPYEKALEIVRREHPHLGL